MWWLALLLSLPLSAAPGKGALRQIRIPVWLDVDPGVTFTARDFSARMEGGESRVLALKGPQDDLMVLLVLDLAGDLTYVDPAKDALIEEIRNAPENVWVGLMRAQDGFKVLADPTRDRDAIAQLIRDLPVSGKAGLLDTVEIGEQLADSILIKAAVRVGVLYVTDSDVANYREDFTNPVINSSDSHDLSRRFPEALIQEKISKIEANLAGRQAPMFIVHLRYLTDRLNEAYQNGLKRLAETTAGNTAFCRSTGEIPAAVRAAVKMLVSHYSLTLAVPEKVPRSFQVQLQSEKTRGLGYRSRFSLRER